jgi:ABC-type sugar transport system ATPase subunit
MGILTVEGLSKSFGGVRALRDVSLSLRAGEIRAICGENGAGKSTLVKSLMGIFTPDAGSIAIDGVRHTMRSPQQAQALGLGLVAQELSLAPRLSVLDNIWLGSADVRLFHRRRDLRRRARTALEILGAGEWDLDTPVSALSIGQQQLVEVARLLARDARILILDEPTATLTDTDAFSMCSKRSRRAGMRSSISATAWARCSISATPSPSCATANMSPPGRCPISHVSN